MNCVRCKQPIELGEDYLDWGGFEYCDSACLVDELKAEGEVEVLVREDYRSNTGTHFPNV